MFASGDHQNSRSAGVKRLLKEAKELRRATREFYARPLEDNLFEWHFTFCGPPETDFAGGIYHGRIVLPHEYPMKPPNLYLLTENGRFETHTKICLSISGYHPETWLPSWSIRTAIVALIAFFPTDGAGAVGSIQCSKEARQRLAIKSLNYHCETCACTMRDVLPKNDDDEVDGDTATVEAAAEASSVSCVKVNGSTAAATSFVNEDTHADIVSSSTSNGVINEHGSNGTLTQQHGRGAVFLYGFCLFACATGFIALLIRRLG